MKRSTRYLLSSWALATAALALPASAQEFLCVAAQTIDIYSDERVAMDKREVALRLKLEGAKATVVRTLPGTARTDAHSYALRVDRTGGQGKPVAVHGARDSGEGPCWDYLVFDIELRTLKTAGLCSGHAGSSFQMFRCSSAVR